MKIYVDRFDGDQGNLGVMSVVDSRGHFVFEKLRIRTGQPTHAQKDWVIGKSPIPYSGQTETGEMHMHLKPNYNSEKSPISSKPNGIGWFWPISDDKNDPWAIKGEGGKRTYIGFHAENAYAGSAGCVVLVHETAEEEAAVIAFNHYMVELMKKGIKTIPMWVG